MSPCSWIIIPRSLKMSLMSTMSDWIKQRQRQIDYKCVCRITRSRCRFTVAPPAAWWPTPSPGSAAGLLQWWPRPETASGNRCRSETRGKWCQTIQQVQQVKKMRWSDGSDDGTGVELPNERRHMSKVVLRLPHLWEDNRHKKGGTAGSFCSQAVAKCFCVIGNSWPDRRRQHRLNFC